MVELARKEWNCLIRTGNLVEADLSLYFVACPRSHLHFLTLFTLTDLGGIKLHIISNKASYAGHTEAEAGELRL